MVKRLGRFIPTELLRPSFFVLAFAILALPLALVLATVTPLGGVFDETEHAARAESLSAGELSGHRGQSYWYDLSPHASAGFDVDATFLTAHEAYATAKVTAADVTQAMGRRWANARLYVEAAFLARYFPVFYAPAALAIASAKLLRITPYDAFFDARLANLAVFAGVGIGALMLARRGQALLFCVLTVPLTLSLAGSLNQDGLLIACSVLAIALLTRVVEDPNAVAADRERTVAAILIGMIALSKLPYVVLTLLLLLPLSSERRQFLARLRLALITALPALLWGAYAMRYVSVPWPPLPAYAPGPLWPGPAGVVFHSVDAAAQFRVVWANPFRILSLTFGYVFSGDIWRSAAGLFPVGIWLPPIVYSAWTCAFMAAGFAAIAGNAPQNTRWRLSNTLLVIGTLCTTIIAFCMGQYLTTNEVGLDHIDMLNQGGRYLLPLIPAIVLGLPVIEARRFKAAASILFIPAAIASLISIAVLPRLVVDVFYIR